MHILLTGGCGYIGSVLTPKLLNAGFKVTIVDIMWFGNFLTDHKNLKIIKQDIRDIDNLTMEDVDVVIHLANVANDPCGDLSSKLTWEVNALATMRLVEWAIRHNAKQFIYASSGSVYGVKEEPQVTEDLPLVPISDYNKAKMVSERVLLSYKDSIVVQCIRPATVCGYSPRMRLDVSVNMLTMQALVNKKITVFGGDQVRPNIHIQDITDLVLFFIEQGEKVKGIYNAGFENISIMDIAKKVTEFVPAEIVVTPSNDPRSYRLNSDKLLRTGFKPKYNVEYAIKEIIDAFNTGNMKDEDGCYNVRTMKKIQDLLQ
ncbi:SDR family oxidoreductase [Patescibacteria group bacterium]|nr:SDR family oxidoreductase [Desulfobacteraceae bacterium]MBU4027145.1 SDR family oxidoreductase [Patescibacteria group bacterium]MBU4069261.1 SDR family oxidoreductase [Pseudomonadota bacterium]